MDLYAPLSYIRNDNIASPTRVLVHESLSSNIVSDVIILTTEL